MVTHCALSRLRPDKNRSANFSRPANLYLIGCLLFLLSHSLSISESSVFADQPDPERPNILWLSTEDIGPHLGCYGDPDAVTPHLDALAKRGVVYDIAWSNYPVCAPARTTIIGGMYAAANAAGNMRSEVLMPPGVEMFPHFLREAGYYCTNKSKEDYNYFKPDNAPWDDSSGKAHYRNRKDGQPFFAVFNYTGTHESKIRKRPHKQVIDPTTVHLASYWPDHPKVRRDWAQYHDNITVMDRWVEKHLKELDRAGLADNTIVIFFGDHGSGMPRHKRFAGDSGMRVPLIVHVPEKLKKLAAKDYAQGSRTQRPTGFIDFAPTVLSIAGIKPPAYMQGQAFMGQFQTASPKYLYGFRDRMDERPDVSRSIRDERFIYVRNYMPHLPAGQFVEYQHQTDTTAVWKKMFLKGKLNDVQAHFWRPHPPEELYDLKSDPEETVNLVDNREFASELDRFREEHRSSYHRFGDLGLIPEPIAFEFKEGKTSRRLMKDADEEFPLDRIFEIANLAADPSPEGLEKLIAASSSPSATIRYWAAMGLLVDGNKNFDAGKETLKRLMEDPNSTVAIVAAQAWANFGNEAERKDGLAKLVELADHNNSNILASVHALVAIDRHKEKKSVAERLKKLPTQDGKTKRGGTYIPALLQSIKTPALQITAP